MAEKIEALAAAMPPTASGSGDHVSSKSYLPVNPVRSTVRRSTRRLNREIRLLMSPPVPTMRRPPRARPTTQSRLPAGRLGGPAVDKGSQRSVGQGTDSRTVGGSGASGRVRTSAYTGTSTGCARTTRLETIAQQPLQHQPPQHRRCSGRSTFTAGIASMSTAPWRSTRAPLSAARRNAGCTPD